MIESYNCPNCHSIFFVTLQQSIEFDPYLELINVPSTIESQWRECSECHSIWRIPVLNELETKLLYNEYRNVAFRNEVPDEYFERLTQLPPEKSECHLKASSVIKAMEEYRPEAISILDIGCGGGILLSHLRSKLGNTAELYGIEPTPSFAELAARRTGAIVSCEMFTNDSYSAQTFDIVTCCAVLEHTVDPSLFMSDIQRVLKNGGLLYLETPDVKEFEVLPKDHDHFTIQHRWYFREERLAALAHEFGLSVLNSWSVVQDRGKIDRCTLLQRNEQ